MPKTVSSFTADNALNMYWCTDLYVIVYLCRSSVMSYVYKNKRW